jgi:hypothetical protein
MPRTIDAILCRTEQRGDREVPRKFRVLLIRELALIVRVGEHALTERLTLAAETASISAAYRRTVPNGEHATTRHRNDRGLRHGRSTIATVEVFDLDRAAV